MNDRINNPIRSIREYRNTIRHLNLKIDIIPFITMKYLSQKQEESKNNLEEFQNKYGFIFRDYELISNIIKKFENNDESYTSDFNSALNALQHSNNNIIKEIFSRISNEKLTNDTVNDILTILNRDSNFKSVYERIHYDQLTLHADIFENTPRFYKLLGRLANINHTPVNVYDPTCKDGQTITNLETFEHATLYEKDEDEYYHLIQNMIINGISLDKLSLKNQDILIDDSETKYDTIISVPYRYDRKQQMISKDEDVGKYGKYGTKQRNSIHLLNLLDHLDDDGVLITSTTQDLLVRPYGYELRKCLVENNLLDSVIEYETGFRSRDITILVIKKNRENDDFLFVKQSQLHFRHFRISRLSEKIFNSYQNRVAIPKLTSIITKEEIIENEYNLNPKRYVYTLDYESRSFEEVLGRQQKYTSQIRQLDDEIEEILKKLTKE